MDYNQINSYLVDIFNKVTIIEENKLKTGEFKDATLKEMHTVDLIGKSKQTTPTDIARELLLTLGTVTTSLNKLEQKGYIERVRSTDDRRVVYVTLTPKGQALYEQHQAFHKEMVLTIVEGMNKSETQAMGRGLVKLHTFLNNLL